MIKNRTNDHYESDVNNSPFTSQYLPRNRINEILDQRSGCKLVYIIAGAGYGKTQAVRHYVKKRPDAVVRWVQLSDGDNIGSNYWEHLTQSISFDNAELSEKLRELGFPETYARFQQFADILKSTEHRANKTFLVLDDFHLIHSKQALTFAERCAHLQIPGACVIIISRKEPEINAVSLFSKGMAAIITEEELLFTEEEIAAFFDFLEIPFNKKSISKYSEATKGWAIAIRLLSLVLKRMPLNHELALNIMKQNIFKLFETEAFNDFPETVQKAMVQLALLTDLPVAPLHVFSDDNSLIQNTPHLSSFIWYDSLTGDYRVHPLYLEFLQSKNDILSAAERQETYRRAAQWCFDNNFHMDATGYFVKSRQYDRVLTSFLSYQFKMPYDTCEHFLSILEEIDPDDTEKNNLNIILLKKVFIPLFLIWTDRYKEARERLLAVIGEYENPDLPDAMSIRCLSYSLLAYLDMYICTATHEHNAPKYIQKAVGLSGSLSALPVKIKGAFAVADIRSFACLVGEGAEPEQFDRFLELAEQTAVYVSEMYNGMYYGYEDLVACEIAFFRNRTDTAKKHAHQAIIKAREKKQFSIEAMAAQYLFRIAMLEGDYPVVKELLKLERGFSESPDFWGRQMLHDVFTGLLYAQAGRHKSTPPWFTRDEGESASNVRIPVRELLIDVKYYFAAKKYDHALTILSNSYPREYKERFIFGELTLSLFMAMAREKTGDIKGAIKDFERAYSLSYSGEFEMPFIERGRDLHPLIAAAARQPGCSIPAQWLKKIDRKASIYAKKNAVILNSFKREKNIREIASLSQREREVLNDIYHGLSREEIAENRYLSINTIHKVIQSIFIKLDAGNNVDAIRIAIDRKLLG